MTHGDEAKTRPTQEPNPASERGVGGGGSTWWCVASLVASRGSKVGLNAVCRGPRRIDMKEPT